MKKSIKFGMLSLVASAILAGCGSSSNSSDTTNSGANTNMTNLMTGYFIDAPVEGLAYQTTSGESGTTDQYGRFHYKEGDKVSFAIGKLSIGEAEPNQEGLVTPEEIAQDDSELKVQLLRVLQALDSDNDPSNGITISEEVINALSALAQEVTINEVKEDDALLKLDETLAEVLDEDYDGVIDVNDTAAEAHFTQSLSKWQNGHKPDQNEGAQENGSSSDNGNGHGQGKGQGKGNGKGNNAQGQNSNTTNQGNGNSSEEHGHGESAEGSAGSFDVTQYPLSTLTQDVKDALAYMGNEERLAYDVYMTLYNYYLQSGDEIKQFKNISERSEIKHVGIVQDLVRRYNLSATDVTNVENPVASNSIAFEEMPMGKYDVPSIQALYDTLYAKGIQSRQDALEVGCMVEVTDVNDLDEWIAKAQAANATDVIEGFKILREGSYNHYWAFDKGLKNMGIADGCAVLGTEYAKTKEEYPSSH